MKRKFVKIGENNGKIYVSGVADRSYRAYDCTCTVCGRTFTATGQDVFKYSDTGCGECRKKQLDEARMDEAQKYIGQKFGMLEIIGVSGYKKVYGLNRLMVSCRCCKCGDIAEYIFSRLKSGEVKQCKHCSRLNLKTGHKIAQDSRVDSTSVLLINGKRKTNKNSTTQHNGVSFMAQSGKYRAYINFRRKQYYLGVYDKLEDAVAARKEAEKEIYGNFMKWYAETYPEQYKRLKIDDI